MQTYKTEPDNYLEYVRMCPEDVDTKDLQMIYTWHSGLTKESFKMRCFLRNVIMERLGGSIRIIPGIYNPARYERESEKLANMNYL